MKMLSASLNHRRRSLVNVSVAFCSGGLLVLVAGCSGSAGSGTPSVSGGTTQTYGTFVTRAVGTAQSPVISASKGATVYGIAGASFTDITQNQASSTSYVPPALNKIVASLDGDLVLMNPDGSNVQPLTFTADEERNPIFSPDGTKILYEKGTGINVMNADGSNVIRLVENGHFPVWSLDGKKIAFSRQVTQYPTYRDDVFVMSSDGSNVEQLTSATTDTDERSPCFSPDGSKIIYSEDGSIKIINIDGTKKVTIASPPNGWWYDLPIWAPNGSKIAYRVQSPAYSSQYSAQNPNIWIMNPDGTKQVNITNSGDVDSRSANNFLLIRHTYSADSQRIYFTRRINNRSITYSISATGGNLQQITNGTDQNLYSPAPSPISVTASVANPTVTKLIGTKGIFGTACAGFLFSQLDKAVTSVITFDTTTTTVAGRAAARVATLSAPETQSQNLVFTITASDGGNLSTLKYTNGASPVASVTLNQNSAIVTFSANDGTVTTILPYAATKAIGSGAPQVTQAGDILTLRGHFPAVWNGKGENIATAGASTVRINVKTGALVDFH